jgi:peptidoglycan/LPS O-acetylase OafA/YrhL
MVGAALICGYALQLGFADTRIARASCHFIGLFALGMVAAYISTSPKKPYQRLRSSRLWGIASALTFIVALSLLPLGKDYFPLLDGVVGIMTTALLVHSTNGAQTFAARALAWRPLVFIGTFSYSVYLIHAPLLQILWQYVLDPLALGPKAMFVSLMSVGLACVLGAAYLFFRMFEAPFMVGRSAARATDAPPAVPA